MIFRPSILITDKPLTPRAALHPILAMLQLAGRAEERLGDNRVEHSVIRVAADPDAHLNFIPVELAARLMVELAARVRPDAVCTAHITYPREVSVATVLELFERRYRVRLDPMAELPRKATRAESVIAALMRGFQPYAFHRRHFERNALQVAGLDPTDPCPIDVDYLMAGC